MLFANIFQGSGEQSPGNSPKRDRRGQKGRMKSRVQEALMGSIGSAGKWWEAPTKISGFSIWAGGGEASAPSWGGRGGSQANCPMVQIL